MVDITLVSPAGYLSRFGVHHGSDRPPTVPKVRTCTAHSSRPALVVAGAAVAMTAFSYGASLAWVFWLVRESGAEWMRQLIGEVG